MCPQTLQYWIIELYKLVAIFTGIFLIREISSLIEHGLCMLYNLLPDTFSPQANFSVF